MHHCPPGAAEYWCQLGSGWAREQRVWSAFQRLPAGSSLGRASQRKMCQRPKLSFCLLIMGWSNCIRSHLKTGFNISVLWHIDTWQSQKYQFSTVPNLTNLQLSQNLSGAHSNRGFDAIQSQQQHFLGSWYILLPISLFQFQSYPNALWRKQGIREIRVCKKCPKVNPAMQFLIQFWSNLFWMV